MMFAATAKFMQIGSSRLRVQSRLAPDMFPLSTQIRFACVQAQEGVFRLQGQALPPEIDVLLGEGRNAAEHPGSMAEARARIEETLAVVNAASLQVLDLDPQAPIAHDLPMGMIVDFTAEQYPATGRAPILLHVMTRVHDPAQRGDRTRQGRLRSHTFAYLRPGTIPRV